MENQTKTKEKDNGQKYVSIQILWNVFLKFWYWILLAAVLVGGLVYALYSYVFYKPVYSSTTKYYVSNIASTTALYSASQTAGAQDMAEIIANLVNADKVLNYVSKDLKQQYNKDVEPGLIAAMISTDVDSAFFEVTVTSGDKELAYQICKSIEKVVPIYSDWCNNQYTYPIYQRNETTGDIEYYIDQPTNTKYPFVLRKEITPFEDVMDDISAGTENESLNSSDTIKIVLSPTGPDRLPDNSVSKLRYPAFAAILVAMATYLIFLIVSINDTTIYSAADLKAQGDRYPVIGNIEHWTIDGEDAKKLKRKKKKTIGARVNVDQKLLLQSHVPFRITEAFHELRTNVTFCAAGEAGCVIGVVSSLAGSGKSFVMANLAVSLSTLPDTKVLLIDADMRCPMLHKIFGLENKNGLSNLIAGQTKEANLHHYNGLDVLTSGTLPPNPIDLLSTAQMKEQIRLWKTQYDYILLDLPPVGEVSDALAISSLISGYITVARAGHSDLRMMADTATTMEEKGAKIYGYVLTDVNPAHYGAYEKYGKYGKYGKYYSYRKYGYLHSEYEKAAQSASEQSNSQK